MAFATKINPQEAAELRDTWLRAVNDLARQVTEWAERQGWTVSRTEQEIDEPPFGAYRAASLEIATDIRTDSPDGIGRVGLSPVARNVLGGEGRVDLYAWPTHYRVMLLRQPDESWRILTDSGIDWPFSWGADTFVDLTRRLIGAK